MLGSRASTSTTSDFAHKFSTLRPFCADALITTLKKLSVRASSEHRKQSKARANSLDTDFGSGTIGNGVKRTNPLFSENDLDLIFEEEDEEEEEKAHAAKASAQAGSKRATSGRDHGAAETGADGEEGEEEREEGAEEGEEERSSPVPEYVMPTFKLPDDCIVVGDINEPIRTIGQKNVVPQIRLGGDKSFISGFSSPFKVRRE